MTYGRVIVKNEYPQAKDGKMVCAEPSEYTFLVANSAYPEQGLGDLIVDLLKGAVNDFNEGLNGAANEMVGELFRQVSADFGGEEVHFDDPHFGVSYTYILAPFDRGGGVPEWKIVALCEGDPKKGGEILTKDDPNHGAWIEENVAMEDVSKPTKANSKKKKALADGTSGRNYRRMEITKLKRCVKELEAEEGDAYERCVAKGACPTADLALAKSVLVSREA